MLLLTYVWQCDLWPLCFRSLYFTPIIISCYERCKYATLSFPSDFIVETPTVHKLLRVMTLKHVSRVKRKHKTRNLQECLCPALFHHENVYRLHGGNSFFFGGGGSCHHSFVQVIKNKGIPRQAEVALGARLRPRIFSTYGTTRMVVRQPNAPAAYDIYLLTAIGLSPGGRSIVHVYTQTIHRTIQNKQYIEQHNNFGRVRAVPRLG